MKRRLGIYISIILFGFVALTGCTKKNTTQSVVNTTPIESNTNQDIVIAPKDENKNTGNDAGADTGTVNVSENKKSLPESILNRGVTIDGIEYSYKDIEMCGWRAFDGNYYVESTEEELIEFLNRISDDYELFSTDEQHSEETGASLCAFDEENQRYEFFQIYRSCCFTPSISSGMIYIEDDPGDFKNVYYDATGKFLLVGDAPFEFMAKFLEPEIKDVEVVVTGSNWYRNYLSYELYEKVCIDALHSVKAVKRSDITYEDINIEKEIHIFVENQYKNTIEYIIVNNELLVVGKDVYTLENTEKLVETNARFEEIANKLQGEVDQQGLSNSTIDLFSNCAIFLDCNSDVSRGDILSSKEYRDILDFLFEIRVDDVELVHDHKSCEEEPLTAKYRISYENWFYLLKEVYGESNPEKVAEKLNDSFGGEMGVYKEDDYICMEVGTIGYGYDNTMLKQVVKTQDGYVITYDVYSDFVGYVKTVDVTIVNADNKYGYKMTDLKQVWYN